MPRRVEDKESKFSKFAKIKILFAKSCIPAWLWLMGITSGIFIIYLLWNNPSFYQKIGIVIIAASFVFILFLFLLHFYSEFLKTKYLIFSGTLILALMIVGKIIIVLPQVPSVFIPIGFLSILFSLFFNLPVSIFVLVMLSCLFSLFSGEISLFPVLLFGGIIGAYGGTEIHQRTDITKVGSWIGLSHLISVVGVGLLRGFSLSRINLLALWGVGNGIFSSILVTAVLPYFETYLGITTDIRLIELADLNHPLLRRLSIEAPGTYHHTIMVATLAVAAAEAVGVNPLLVRIGAYYHDIGKVLRPHFFFENSRVEGEVIDHHSRVSPGVSSVIIVSHVKDGLELGRIYKLPQKVLDIIAQHHGTSLIAYFYRKAIMKKGEKEHVDESSFRYPGPKPQSKEAAIVMLADSVEADSRFASGKSHKEISSQVHRVINNKLKDNQLDEVDLTLRDLTKIAEAFIRVLASRSHRRGRYPEEMLKNEEGINYNQQYVGGENSGERY